MPTKIEWAEETINPLPGCTKISEACQNCYAVRMANRFKGTKKYHGLVENGDWTGRINYWPNDLKKPFQWEKPRRIFVNSMGDLFHGSLFNGDYPGGEWLRDIFNVMDIARHHQYLILTKRPDNMKRYLECSRINLKDDYPHVWVGVTAENQPRLEDRVTILLQIPAAVRFVSVEPMLGPINLRHMDVERHHPVWCMIDALTGKHTDMGRPCPDVPKLDWVICGGETGPGSRPMHPDWIRLLRDQCVAADVPFFFKSWGDWEPSEIRPEIDTCYHKISDGKVAGYTSTAKHHWWGGSWGDGKPLSVWVGKKKSGREIDGRTWDQLPVL
jgi:protein gp37